MDGLESLNQEWFKNEALSNYITFGAGIIFAILGWFIVRIITRKKPSIIRVDKIVETSLIDIHKRIQDKLKITYEDRPIDGFHETIFMIRNTGEKPIEDIELIFAIEDLSAIDFLEVEFTNAERIEELMVFNPKETSQNDTPVKYDPEEYDPVALDPDAFSIFLPFLNPYKVYEDYLGLTLYTPKPIIVKGVVGKGLGWTTRYVDKSVYYDKYMKLFTSTTFSVIYILGRILKIF